MEDAKKEKLKEEIRKKIKKIVEQHEESLTLLGNHNE